MRDMRDFCLRLMLSVLASISAFAANAADRYPNRPITFVVGFSAGGATDILARIVAKELSEELGQPVVVDNKAGAGSNIGAEVVARSKPDGYTLYAGTIANTINTSLYKKLNYNFTNDFVPVALLTTIPNMLVVNPSLPIQSVKEYLSYARSNPGKLTCASSGIGSSIHLSCELFKQQTQTQLLHIPYRGSGPAVSDLLGGQVASMFDNFSSSLSHVRAGSLRAIAVTSAERSPFAPDVPTFKESGLPDFVVQSWFGVVAPTGTPSEIVVHLNRSINKALSRPSLKDAFEKNGFAIPPEPNSIESFKQLIASEVMRWRNVIQAANIQAE